jgi:hypothetical protein
MTPKEKFLEAVGERDIDLLLLEEFHVSAQFQTWFAAKALGTERHGCRFEAASHAVSDPMLGESDLIAYYIDPEGQVLAILIEDKIDAAAQPEQAARYLKRGEAGISAGHWTSFRTCIVGPRNYLDSAPDAAGYQVRITYEEVCEFLGSLTSRDERYIYRKRLVEEAIEQSRRGYQPEDHPAVHQFWQRYWETVKTEFPELRMSRPKAIIPFNSDWPNLHAPGVRRGWRIIHKWNLGYVDLKLPSRGGQVDDIRARNALVLDTDILVEQTGKAAAIRFEVPRIDRLGSFDAQLEAVRTGLHAARRLAKISPKIELPE